MPVSIAKAIPSLLERGYAANVLQKATSFNRESDSVTVGAPGSISRNRIASSFQSRKRFRHCWSGNSEVRARNLFSVSIAKAIPSLLERHVILLKLFYEKFQSRKRFRHCWSRLRGYISLRGYFVSIAKAIPSLLEQE